MTRTEWYDFKEYFYNKYVPHVSNLEALKFNRFLTWICILSSYFDAPLNIDIKEFNIQELIKEIEENTSV